MARAGRRRGRQGSASPGGELEHGVSGGLGLQVVMAIEDAARGAVELRQVRVGRDLDARETVGLIHLVPPWSP